MVEERSRFINRTNPTNSWVTYNPVLRKGEIGIEETGSGLFLIKIGDGETPWNNLPYAEPYTDTTLRLHDVAADAWAVGSRINYIENKLDSYIAREEKILSFVATPTQFEPGQILTSIQFAWEYEQDSNIVLQSINGNSINLDLTQYTYTGAITQSTIFTLSATDIRGNVFESSIIVSPCAKVYYGVAQEPVSYTSAFINGLNSKFLADTDDEISINATTDKYIYYCLPLRYGARTMICNDIAGGFSTRETVSFTNSYGNTEDYYVYRSDYPSLGNTKIKVVKEV